MTGFFRDDFCPLKWPAAMVEADRDNIAATDCVRNMISLVRCRSSHPQNHYFRCLDQRGGAFAGFEAHFPSGIGGDERCDVLFADPQSDLSEQTVILDGDDAADELIAAADFAEIATASGECAAFEFLGDEAIDFAFRDAMVPAGSFGCFEFAMVDPLLEGGIADAEDVSGFAGGEKSLQGAPSGRTEYYILKRIFNTIKYT